jgi:hypothetical protein
MLRAEEWRDIMLADMQWIKDADSLRVYGHRFKRELAANQFSDELRTAYRKRMAELDSKCIGSKKEHGIS